MPRRHQHEFPHTDLQVRWQNFRPFEDTGWLTFRPLTVLLGANNSGKTSVLAPLLLLNQTMASRDLNAPLVSQAELFEAPSFTGLVRDHDEKRQIELGLRFHTHSADEDDLETAVGDVPPGVLEVALRAGEEPDRAILTKFAIQDIYLRTMLTRILKSDGTYSVEGLPRQSEMSPTEMAALRRSTPLHFMFAPAYEVSQFISPEGEKRTPRSPPDFTQPFSLYLTMCGFVFTEVSKLLDRLSYVGPLRERLKHHYRTQPIPRTVGPTGKDAANLLLRRYDDLEPALNKWISAFDLGEKIVYRYLSKSKDLFALELVSGRRRLNVADAGFGTSQVLPLIVQALAAEKGSVLLAEQPEIHLNPRLQATLADLFVSMATNNRPVVVETHSEHLLLRLRRLIADDVIPANRVALYFVERKGDHSQIRQIEIGPNGHIDPQEWPADFFGDTLQESLALARSQAKKLSNRAR